MSREDHSGCSSTIAIGLEMLVAMAILNSRPIYVPLTHRKRLVARAGEGPGHRAR
jgi:hypothetical protein